MAKLLLVHPLFLSKSPAEQAAASPYFPLGILYLAAYVRDNGHEVAIFDGTFELDETAFDEVLTAVGPDIVGISTVLPTRDMACSLAAMAKARGLVVVVGGPDATRDPCGYLDESAVDIVVHHEGEQTITTLLDLVESGMLDVEGLDDVLGVAFRRGTERVVNESRPPIENLDELPLPARDLIDMDRYLESWREANNYSSITIAATRGCPHGCEWCRDSVHGTDYRWRSPESVAAEVKILSDTFGIDRLRLIDDVDGIDRSWLESWATSAEATNAVVPFEALNDLDRQDIPMLDVRDTL